MLPRSQEHAVIKIPPPLVSYEDVCAMIVPGMIAWHALIEVARLSPGEKILIHSAAGATGAVSCAGCEDARDGTLCDSRTS